jgi:hypothetical protein
MPVNNLATGPRCPRGHTAGPHCPTGCKRNGRPRKARRQRRDWPADQDARLRALAGHASRHTIATILTAEFPDFPRTVDAVSAYANGHGISLWAPGRSLSEVGVLLGVSIWKVRTWIELDMLETFAYHAVDRVKGLSCRRVTDDALRDFIRHHAEHFRHDRIQGTSELARLARAYARPGRFIRYSKPPPKRRKQSLVAA